MKHARKLTSLLLALVMVFALAVTAAAEGTTTAATGSITVDNPITDKTYTAYKIFDVVYDDAATKHYSYTIDSGNEWYSTVSAYAATTTNGLTLTKVGDSTSNTYVVTTTGDFSAPAFADALKAAVGGMTGGTELSIADGKATATGLDLGYYFVTSTNGALCNLTTTNPTVTIHDKNDMPFSKTDDKVSAEVGEKVNYTITGKVPDYTGFTTYTYKITDTMTDGLTFQNDVKVFVSDKDVTLDCTRTYDAENNANTFTVSIPVKSYTIGAEIKVTYSALVNEKAVGQISNNSATLTYSNNPSEGTEATTTPVVETVYSSRIVIDKHKTGDEDTKLKGAEFVLYKEVTPAGGTATKQYYKWNEESKEVEWVAEQSSATVKTTNDQGAASFDGPTNGTYYLVETKAPAGYNQLTDVKTIIINGDDTGANLIVTEKVENKTGTILPSTGGMGTTVFYVLGFVLVVGAGVLLVTKKRMSQSEV